MGERITEEDFLREVRGFQRDAFRLEARAAYALDYELEDFERFLAGRPRPPSEIDWWSPWLDRMRWFGSEGKHVSRVRILSEPPTDYQRWMLWSTPWHSAVGEDIRYLARSRAQEISIPLEQDWWLLDGERVIVMHFTDAGELGTKELITEPEDAAVYRFWRDMALRNATAAGNVAAA
jgi:hypothetical protein